MVPPSERPAVSRRAGPTSPERLSVAARVAWVIRLLVAARPVREAVMAQPAGMPRLLGAKPLERLTVMLRPGASAQQPGAVKSVERPAVAARRAWVIRWVGAARPGPPAAVPRSAVAMRLALARPGLSEVAKRSAGMAPRDRPRDRSRMMARTAGAAHLAGAAPPWRPAAVRRVARGARPARKAGSPRAPRRTRAGRSFPRL
jgi:hypothetical protein